MGKMVIFAATLSATLIFSTVASSAVACFGILTPQDLLSRYPPSLAVTVARAGMAVVCCGFFPLLVQPVRTTCLGWMGSALSVGLEFNRDSPSQALIGSRSPGAVKLGYDQAVKHTLDLAYPAITLLIGGLSLGIALVTSSLGMVFSLSGATGFALLCNVCPPWLYLVVAPREGERLMRASAWALIVYGVIMMPLCITANFMAALPTRSFSNGANGAQCMLPPSCSKAAFCLDAGG